MKVKFETTDRKFEHEYYGIDNCTQEMMLYIHLDLMREHSDLITDYGITTFPRHNSKVAITTTVEERR